jgi:RNA polymerase sigma-70 factor (ECF subfamily)
VIALEERLSALLERRELSQAAAVAIEGYGPQVLGYLIAVMRNESDARDVFSQFCEDLWRGLGTFRGECSFRTWSYKLARHALSRFERDPYRRRGRRLETDEISRLAASVVSQAPAAARDEQLERARQVLSVDDQTLLILRLDRKLSWTEVAEVLAGEGDAPDEAALRKRFERIKNRLRELVAGDP